MINMADITDKDVGPTNLGTLAVAGVAKYGGERVMAPVVGNASLVSGAAKLAVGVGMDSFTSNNSTIGEGVALGVGIDGIEDILTVIFGKGSSFGAAGDVVEGLTNTGDQGAPGNTQVM